MKQNIINIMICLSAVLSLSLLATSCGETEVPSALDEGTHTYIMYLDEEWVDFANSTRASGNSWAANDTIFFSFSNGGTRRIGTGVYNTDGSWKLTTDGSLSELAEAKCSGYYFRGGHYKVNSTTVTFDEQTAVFGDENATYSVEGSTIYAKASIKAQTWRLRFKGTANKNIVVREASGISYGSSLDRKSGALTKAAKDVSLTVASNGYTPYIYGTFQNATNTLTLEVGTSIFKRTVSSSSLANGKSGYYSIPTSESHAGWEEEKISSDGEYIDLGLPSGVMWASCNLGASTPDGYGLYYAWGETTGSNASTTRNFNWSSYLLCNGSQYSMKRYCTNSSYGTVDNVSVLKYSDDAAHVALGDKWRMPTDEEFSELTNKCTMTSETLNGVSGRRFTSTVNGNSIFMPLSGCFEGTSYKNAGTYGNYWTSSLFTTSYQAYGRWFDKTGSVRRGGLDRCYGETIRPVYDPDFEEPGDAQDFDVNDYGDETNLDDTGIDDEGATSQDISLDGYGDDQSLDDTSGSGVEHTGGQNIDLDGYGDDQSLDGTGGGGDEHTGDQDINLDGYDDDQCLD